MLKSEIFTAGARSHGVYTMLCVTHDNGEKFSQIFMNTGK